MMSTLNPTINGTGPSTRHGFYHASVDAYKRRLLESVLARCHGSPAAAARELGLARPYLYRLMRRLEIGGRR